MDDGLEAILPVFTLYYLFCERVPIFGMKLAMIEAMRSHCSIESEICIRTLIPRQHRKRASCPGVVGGVIRSLLPESRGSVPSQFKNEAEGREICPGLPA